MTIEGYDRRERILLSYDVSEAPRTRRVHVCRIVFGRSRSDSSGKVRLEKGFVHRPGVVWVGQSVLVMPPDDAAELRNRLTSLGVDVNTAPVSMDRDAVERFRWRRSD